MNYDDARRLLADEPFLPSAGETPTDYSSRVDAFQRDDAERAEKERQKAQKAADAAAKKAENERSAAIRRTASEDAKNTQAFVEDVFKPKEAELSTRKAEIEDQWRKDEEAAKPRVFGLLGPDPAAQSRLPQHAQAWQKTQDELDKWTTGTQELEKRTRSLVARKDAMDDVDYADDQEKITGSPEEKGRALNSAIQKRLSPDAPADYQENYRDEMKRKGYELTDTKPDTSGATQPEQAPSAGQNAGQTPDLTPKSHALELSIAQKLEKDVLAGRKAILDEDLRAKIDKNEWKTLSPEQKKAKIADLQAQKMAKLDAYDAQQAGMSPDRAAIIESATGMAPVTDVAAEAIKETGRRAAQAGVAIYKGVQDVTLGAVDTLSFVEAAARGVKPEETNTHVFAQGARQQTEEWMGANPEENGVASLAQGIGSSMAFLPAGVFGGIPGVIIAGAAQGFGPGYYDAKEMARQNGVEITEQQAYMRALISAGLGSTEALPISRAFDRLDKMTGGALKVLIDPLKEAGEEFIQEFGQNVIQDAYDKITGLNDKAWTKILGDGFESGKIAALSGLLMGITMNAAAQRDWKKRYTDRAEVLTNLDENTKHMTAEAVYTKGAEALNRKNDRLLELRDTLGALEGQITPTTEETERKRIQGEIDAAKKELADIEVTKDVIQVAADITDGTTSKFSQNEAEVSRLRAAMEALRPAKGTFWNPTDYEKLTQTQEELTLFLDQREKLYNRNHTEEESARFRAVLGAAKDISKFPDAPSDPDGNGKSPGSSQRAIMTAIWKAANGQPLTPAELDLKAGKSGRVFKVDNKTGTVQVANDYVATQMKAYRAQLEAAAQGQPITNQVLAAYEKASQQPQPIVRPVQAQEGTPAQTQGQTATNPAAGPSNGPVQASRAPGVFRVGVSSTMNGQPVAGAGTVDVEAFTEDEAVAKVVSGEVAGPTVTGNQQFAVHQVVRAPVDAVYTEESQPEQTDQQTAAEPEVDAAAAIEEAKKATAQSVERLMPFFKGVTFIHDPNESNAGMVYETSTGYLRINAAMLDVANKEQIRAVAIEEALHAVLSDANIDAAGIWEAIDANAQISLLQAYPTLARKDATDHHRGHEFLRMFLQKKINFTADGRIMWDDNGTFKTSEETNRNVNLIQRVRDAVRKIVDYIQGVLDGVTDTDANKEIKRAYDVAKERFEWLSKITANEQKATPKAAEQQADEVSEPGSAEQKSATPAADEPAEQEPEQEPVAQEAPPPPKGNVAALERKLSEKAFQSVNVPNEQFAAYLQGRADSQKAGTKPLSDKDITALFEYYYAKGDEDRLAIIDAEMARRANEEEAEMAQAEIDRTTVDLGEKLRGKIRRTGNPKQEQGEIDHMLDGWDTFTPAQKKRVRSIFVGGETEGLPTLDILRDNLSSEGIEFDTIHEMLEAVAEYVTTGSYGDADIFSQPLTHGGAQAESGRERSKTLEANGRKTQDVRRGNSRNAVPRPTGPIAWIDELNFTDPNPAQLAQHNAEIKKARETAESLGYSLSILNPAADNDQQAIAFLAGKRSFAFFSPDERRILIAPYFEQMASNNEMARRYLREEIIHAAQFKVAEDEHLANPQRNEDGKTVLGRRLEGIVEELKQTQAGRELLTSSASAYAGSPQAWESVNEATEWELGGITELWRQLHQLREESGLTEASMQSAYGKLRQWFQKALRALQGASKQSPSPLLDEAVQQTIDILNGKETDLTLASQPGRTYESMEFAPPFQTSRGEILTYNWMNDGRRSDWTQAKTNPETGREIVHHFKMRSPKGDVMTVSLETAMGALSADRRKKLTNIIDSEMQRRRDAAAGQGMLFSQAAPATTTNLKTIKDANKPVRFANGTILVPPDLASQRAYHGTPHKVDRFSLDKIGTGEGVQAYGWGLYFAEARAVGEEYQRSLGGTEVTYGSRSYRMDKKGIFRDENKTPSKKLPKHIYGAIEGIAASSVKATRQQQARDAARWLNTRSDFKLQDVKAAVDAIISGDVTLQPTGNLYSVELDVESDELLDWDNPTNQKTADAFKAALGKTQVVKLSADSFGITRIQPDGSGNLIRGISRTTAAEAQAELDGLFFGISGEGAYNMLQSLLGASPKATSEELRGQGITGIRYLDQGSRRVVGGEIVSIWQGDQNNTTPSSTGKWFSRVKVTGTNRQGSIAPDMTFTTSPGFETREQAEAWAKEKTTARGTYNYVIFDEARIKITAENDVALASQATYPAFPDMGTMLDRTRPTPVSEQLKEAQRARTEHKRGLVEWIKARLPQPIVWDKDETLRYVLTRQPNNNDAYRVTSFGKERHSPTGSGFWDPMGHREYDTIEEAVDQEPVISAVASYGDLFSQRPADHPAQAAQLILDFDAAPKPASVQQAALTTDEEERDLAMRRRDAVPLTPEQAKTVEDNMGLAGMVANRAVGFGWDRDDAMQEASIALMRASRTFDEARGIKFSTFATQVMTRHLISVNAKAGNRNARNATSLDETISEDDGDTTKKDLIAQDVGRFTERPDADGIRIVAEVLASIPPRVQTMLRKYGAGMTQEEIAEELGISRQAVSKAIANGAESMRKRLEARGITRTLDIFPERGITAPTMMQPSRSTTDDESDSEVIDPREGDRPADYDSEQELRSQPTRATFDTVTPEQARAELGRAQPDDALILTPTGWWQIGSLLVGDHVLDEQGAPQTVEAIYDQGTVPIFRITTEAGRTVESSADHLWQTDQEEAEGNVITTTDRLAPGIRIPVATLA